MNFELWDFREWFKLEDRGTQLSWQRVQHALGSGLRFMGIFALAILIILCVVCLLWAIAFIISMLTGDPELASSIFAGFLTAAVLVFVIGFAVDLFTP